MSVTVPTLPSSIDPKIRQAIRLLTEAINAQQTAGSSSTGGGGVTAGATGGGGGGVSYYSIPNAPTGLIATGLYNQIILQWDAFSQFGYAYMEVWRAETDNLGVAVKIGATPAAMYLDSPPDQHLSKTYYYWIRAVNKNDPPDYGPYNATNGVAASTADDPGYLIEVLSGEITEGMLYNDLRDTIAKITVNEADIASSLAQINLNIGDISQNAADIITEQTARANGDTALAQQITTLTSDIGDNTALIHTEETARADGDSALSTRIDAVVSTAGDNTAAIVSETTTRANDDAALSHRLDTLYTVADDNTALIQNEQTARANEDSALATSITTHYARAVSNVLRGSQRAMVVDGWENIYNHEIVDVAGPAGLTALRLSTLSGYPNSGVFIPVNTGKIYRVKFWAKPSSDCNGRLYFCLRQYINESTTGPVNGGRHPYKPSSVSRAVHESLYGVGNWGEYIYDWNPTDWQSGVTLFLPEFLNNYSGSTGYWDIQGLTIEDAADIAAAEALIQNEQTARVNGDDALAQDINNLQTSVNGNTIALQTKASVSAVDAIYEVKIDANGRVTGFGMVADSNSTEFGILADRFWIADPDNPGDTQPVPFIVDGRSVYINTALIKTATITNAMIESVAADKITAGTITAALAIVGSVMRSSDNLVYLDMGNKVLRMQDASSGDYVQMTPGELEFYRGGTLYKSVKRVIHGTASSGGYVAFYPAFVTTPKVFVSANNTPVYNPAQPSLTQYVNFFASGVSTAGFTPFAYLTYTGTVTTHVTLNHSLQEGVYYYVDTYNYFTTNDMIRAEIKIGMSGTRGYVDYARYGQGYTRLGTWNLESGQHIYTTPIVSSGRYLFRFYISQESAGVQTIDFTRGGNPATLSGDLNYIAIEGGGE